MATTQSDKSIIGDIQKAKVTARQVGHRDLDLSLKIHPIRKDIIPLKDDNAIKNAIRNLLVSNFSKTSSTSTNYLVERKKLFITTEY